MSICIPKLGGVGSWCLGLLLSGPAGGGGLWWVGLIFRPSGGGGYTGGEEGSGCDFAGGGD